MPSGKLTELWNITILFGKLTVSMAIVHSCQITREYIKLHPLLSIHITLIYIPIASWLYHKPFPYFPTDPTNDVLLAKIVGPIWYTIIIHLAST